MDREMKPTEKKCVEETMIYQNLVANVLLDESKKHSSPGAGDLIAIWSHDFGKILNISTSAWATITEFG